MHFYADFYNNILWLAKGMQGPGITLKGGWVHTTDVHTPFKEMVEHSKLVSRNAPFYLWKDGCHLCMPTLASE